MAESTILKIFVYGMPLVPAIAICLLFYGLYLYFFAFKARADVDIEAISTDQSVFKEPLIKVFWATEGKGFTGRNSSEVTVYKGQKSYSILIDHLVSLGHQQVSVLINGSVKIHVLFFITTLSAVALISASPWSS